MNRKIIFRCKSGSFLYGLNRPESDIDYFTIFMPNAEDVLGLQKMEMVDNSSKSSAEDRRNTSEDIDDMMYSLPKYLHLLLQNNPNIVETLFARPEVVEVMEPEFQFLMSNYQKILSQRVFFTFTGYATSQKKKLTVKSERYGSLVEAVKYLEEMYSVKDLTDTTTSLTEEDGMGLNALVKHYRNLKGSTESFHKGLPLKTIYEKLVEERDNYGWRVKTDTFDTLGYDCKFGYHLVRILAEGHQLLTEEKLTFPISGEAREDILSVREGKVILSDLLKIYEKWDTRCKEASETTQLPKKPDFNFVNDWLIETLKKHILTEG